MPRFVLLIIVISSGGCTLLPNVTTHVEVFHDLPSDYVGKSIMVISADQNKAGTPEFKTYASKLSAKLEAAGFRVVSPETHSFTDYTAAFAYGVGAQQIVGAYTMGNAAINAMDGIDYKSSTFLEKEYPRAFAVSIVKNDNKKGTPTRYVYMMTAASSGGCRTLSSVIEPMLDAAFADFPGKSGEAYTVITPTLAEISC